MKKEIIIIAAVAKNGVIGKGNTLPWRLPDDVKFFAEQTTNHTVIMGRKSWESIPLKYKPLPNRRNIVLTKTLSTIHGAEVFTDLNSAIEASTGKVFIIGGAEIYTLALPLITHLVITQIDAEVEGDVIMEQLKPTMLNFSVDHSYLKEVSRIHHPIDEKHKYSFDFVTFEKIV